MTSCSERSEERGHAKFQNVPIAVTREGFWCCPSPAGLQKTLNAQANSADVRKYPPNFQKYPLRKAKSCRTERRYSRPPLMPGVTSDDPISFKSDSADLTSAAAERSSHPSPLTYRRKITVRYGESESSNLKIILFGREGTLVKLRVHKNVLVRQSKFFADKLSDVPTRSYIEIERCEDVDIFIETVGLMYCKEMKQRLIKQSVSRVLRVMKAAELLGFPGCLQSCLEYLEAAPWSGEEEEKVISSVLHLHTDIKSVIPVLKRVSSEHLSSLDDTLSQILELVLKSSEERGRRDMKSLVLKLVKENNALNKGVAVVKENIYPSCQRCLNSLMLLFTQSAAAGSSDKILCGEISIKKQIALQCDNLLWLLEMLIALHAAGTFIILWTKQTELAKLHSKLPVRTRYFVSFITSRLFVMIGRGEILPSKETRQVLLQTWFQPLIDDYSWLQHGCRSFDKKTVEEGIGRTILTLPLEEQQNIFLSWMNCFLETGSSCPDLQRAFEIWWRQTFIRASIEQHSDQVQSSEGEKTATLKCANQDRCHVIMVGDDLISKSDHVRG